MIVNEQCSKAACRSLQIVGSAVCCTKFLKYVQNQGAPGHLTVAMQVTPATFEDVRPTEAVEQQILARVALVCAPPATKADANPLVRVFKCAGSL